MENSTTNSTDSTFGTTEANGDPFRVYQNYWGRQVFAAVCITTSVIGITGNSLVIAAVWMSKKLRTVTNVFVVSLSVSDLLSSVFMPWQALSVLSEDGWPLPRAYWLCLTTSGAVLIGNGCSINSLALIAVNRCIGITKPKTTAARIYSRRNIACMVAFSWLVPMCCTLLPSLTGFGELGYEPLYSICSWVISNPYSNIYNILGIVFYFPIQLTIIALCYMVIFYYVLRTSRRTAQQNFKSISGELSAADRAMRERMWKRQIAITKNMVYIVLAYVICLTPFFIVLVSDTSIWVIRMAPYAGLVVYCNCCLNPIIYAISHPDFKETFGNMVRCNFQEIPKGRTSKKIQLQTKM